MCLRLWSSWFLEFRSFIYRVPLSTSLLLAFCGRYVYWPMSQNVSIKHLYFISPFPTLHLIHFNLLNFGISSFSFRVFFWFVVFGHWLLRYSLKILIHLIQILIDQYIQIRSAYYNGNYHQQHKMNYNLLQLSPLNLLISLKLLSKLVYFRIIRVPSFHITILYTLSQINWIQCKKKRTHSKITFVTWRTSI